MVRSPKRGLPLVNQDQVDHLKRLDEWEAVIAMFQRDLFKIQDAMCSSRKDSKELMALAAKGEVTALYLERALEKPADRRE